MLTNENMYLEMLFASHFPSFRARHFFPTVLLTTNAAARNRIAALGDQRHCSGMRTRNDALYEARRKEILAAAAACLFRDGLHGTTIPAICAEAGIGSGNLYHYFANKNAIVAALVESMLADGMADIAGHARAERPLASLIDGIEATMVRGATRARIAVEMAAEAYRNPVVRQGLDTYWAGIRGEILALIRKSQALDETRAEIDADIACAALLAVFGGASTLALHSPQSDPVQVAAVLAGMLRSLLA